MKKIAIMQPYLFPYIGYFQLLSSVDLFVIYDDVSYIKGGWINRNNLLLNGKEHLWTLSLSSPSPNKLIKDILLFDPPESKRKLLELHKNAYRKAPYFKVVFPILETILKDNSTDITSLVENSLRILCVYLGINTQIIRSSSFEKDYSLQAETRLIQMVKNLGFDQYINAIGGTELYSKENWEKNGLGINFLKSNLVEYPQGTESFIPYLSIIDIMMFNSQDDVQKMIGNYELI